MKNKKFNYFTIVIYVLIIAALVVFVTSGNESVNKKPDELKTMILPMDLRTQKSLPFRSRRKLFTACMCRTGNLKAAKISAKNLKSSKRVKPMISA